MTLGTSIATRIYLSDSRFPENPSGDTVVALGYQWRHQEILSGTRVPVGAQENSVVT